MISYVTWKWWERIIDWLLRLVFDYRDIWKAVEEGGDEEINVKFIGVPIKGRSGNYTVYQVLYIRRYYVRLSKTKGNIFIHAIRRSDDDRDPHDHPWDFRARLLIGSYEEDCWGGYWQVGQNLWRASWHVKHHIKKMLEAPAEHTHKLTLNNGPVWTLVTTGPARRRWGFWTPKGWVYWRDYLGAEDEVSVEDEHAEQT